MDRFIAQTELLPGTPILPPPVAGPYTAANPPGAQVDVVRPVQKSAISLKMTDSHFAGLPLGVALFHLRLGSHPTVPHVVVVRV